MWPRPAAAALIQPLAWELPYVTEAALKRFQKKKKKVHSFPPRDLGHDSTVSNTSQ